MEDGRARHRKNQEADFRRNSADRRNFFMSLTSLIRTWRALVVWEAILDERKRRANDVRIEPARRMR
jgi:hypothetical protein